MPLINKCRLSSPAEEAADAAEESGDAAAEAGDVAAEAADAAVCVNFLPELNQPLPECPALY
jgi:hypothetical protein